MMNCEDCGDHLGGIHFGHVKGPRLCWSCNAKRDKKKEAPDQEEEEPFYVYKGKFYTREDMLFYLEMIADFNKPHGVNIQEGKEWCRACGTYIRPIKICTKCDEPIAMGRYKEPESNSQDTMNELNIDVYSLFPNRTISSVNHKASKFGLKRKMQKRKYEINSAFFDTWSSDMAYVLGWFFSDGNVGSNSNNCQIHLHIDDVGILYKISDIMDSNYPISIYDNSVMFRCYDYMLRQSLILLGCVPRKSLIVEFPAVPDEFLNHFIRGYFDGDGSISVAYENPIRVSFVGSKKFINGLYKSLLDSLCIDGWYGCKKDSVSGNTFIYSCCGDNAMKLCEWLYMDSGALYLKRKRMRYDAYLKKQELDVHRETERRESLLAEYRIIANNNGGECLSDFYLRAHSYIKWRCEFGHEWKAVANSIKLGHWCPYCAGVKTDGDK